MNEQTGESCNGVLYPKEGRKEGSKYAIPTVRLENIMLNERIRKGSLLMPDVLLDNTMEARDARR